MTRDQLQALSRKELAEMARKRGIDGWHGMRKDELIEALVAVRGPTKGTSGNRPSAPSKPAKTPVANKPAMPMSAKPVDKNNHGAISRKPHGTNGTAMKGPIPKAVGRDLDDEDDLPKSNNGVPTKDLSEKVPKSLPTGYSKDRIVTMVRDPYWLHTYWELSHQSIQRAEAALGQDWHTAKPILRIFDVSANDTTSTSEAIVKDIDVHGGCQNWYIEVQQPSKSYRVDIGYVSRRNHFFVIARSNVVTTPKANVSDCMDENWTEIDSNEADRIFAMSTGYDSKATSASVELKQLFEERLRRPIGAPSVTGFGTGAVSPEKARKLTFTLDAELIVYGKTDADARVTLQGEPVKLRPDGTFTMRYSLPDSRQIIPAVAAAADGVEERTIVLAIERNTKHLEPMIHEINDSL
jgi:hypothetical protein